MLIKNFWKNQIKSKQKKIFQSRQLPSSLFCLTSCSALPPCSGHLSQWEKKERFLPDVFLGRRGEAGEKAVAQEAKVLFSSWVSETEERAACKPRETEDEDPTHPPSKDCLEN